MTINSPRLTIIPPQIHHQKTTPNQPPFAKIPYSVETANRVGGDEDKMFP
jgi:hypothetical protein